MLFNLDAWSCANKESGHFSFIPSVDFSWVDNPEEECVDKSIIISWMYFCIGLHWWVNYSNEEDV